MSPERVSNEQLALEMHWHERQFRFHLEQGGRRPSNESLYALDLRDARAALAERDAEIARLRANYKNMEDRYRRIRDAMYPSCPACLGEGKKLINVPATWTQPAEYDVSDTPCEECGGSGHQPSKIPDNMARLRDFVDVLLKNDPHEIAADGVTVLDVWRKDAADLLAALRAAPTDAPYKSDEESKGEYAAKVMKLPTASTDAQHEQDVATIRLGIFCTDIFVANEARAALDRLAARPSRDAFRDAALEEAARIIIGERHHSGGPYREWPHIAVAERSEQHEVTHFAYAAAIAIRNFKSQPTLQPAKEAPDV